MPIVKEKGLADVASKAGNSVGKVASGAANGGAAMHGSVLTNMLGAAKAGLGNVGSVAASAGSSLWHGATSFVAGIPGAVANGVGGFFAGAGSWVSSTFGVSATAGTAAAATAAGLGAVGAVGGGLAMINNQGQYDVAVTDCGTVITQSAEKASAAVNTEAITLDNAKKVWSVFKAYGLSNEQIAGILGNWSVESGIDPSGFEGIYSEHFQPTGPKHTDAYNNMNAWTESLFSQYAAQGLGINHGAYKGSDGNYYPGLGLGQWTGGNGEKLIGAAKSVNKNWYDLDFQLAYALATPSPTGIQDYWNKYKKESGSASAMAMSFTHDWEGNAGMAYAERQAAAEHWLSQMASWTEDSAFSASVISMSQNLGMVASDGAASSALQSCTKAQNYDNSSAAAAAISYAYETEEESKGNNGTKLWQTVFQNIFPGDSNYMSCDRTVATALRWSGTDEEIPAGDCPALISYFSSSDKWEKVGLSHDLEEKDLKPGDIIIRSRHVIMYVGNELVKQKYPNSNGNMVSGSLGERSPGVGSHIEYYLKGGAGESDYTVYRCVKPDNGTKYKDAGAGAN
jgi:hypothetical protein